MSSVLDQLSTCEIEEIAVTVSKEDRIAACGKNFAKALNVHTGRYRAVAMKCGCARECPICRREKADKYRQTMASIAGDTNVYMCVVEDDEATQISKALGKDDYRRFPLEDGGNIVIYRDMYGMVSQGNYNAVDCVEFTNKILNEVNWEAICVSPHGKRISGSLGDKPVSGQETVKNIVVVAPTATKKDWTTAIKASNEATKDLRPTNKIELESCIQQRTAALSNQFTVMYVKHWTSFLMVPFNQAKLDWAQSREIVEDI